MINELRDIQPEKAFLIIGLIFGIAFLCINPPFQAPDESHHYYKSLYLSSGHIIPEKLANVSGVNIPENTVQVFKKFENIPFHPENKINVSYEEIINIPLQPRNTIFIDMSNVGIVTYSPIPYLASGLFIFIGKLFNLSPLLLMYLGRLANLLLYVLIVFMAIKITPVHKWVLSLLALMPMTLFLAASLSADSFTFAISFLLIAMFFKLAFDKEKKEINLKNTCVLIVLGIMIALSKQIYLLLLLLFFMIPSPKFGNRKKMFLSFIGILLPVILITGIWSLLVSGLYVAPLTEISVQGQISFIISNPLVFVQACYNSISLYHLWYLVTFVGSFGWLDTPLPDNMVYIYLIAIILVSLLDNQEEKIKNLMKEGISYEMHQQEEIINTSINQKLISITTFLMTFIAIFGMEYITWTSVGNNIIDGVQGRYFIPIAPLFFFLFYNKKIRVNQNVFKGIIILFILIILSFSLHIIINRFYNY
jgi:uncharacterized membrane protein